MSAARRVELIGEKWAFLILRGALNGLHHFEEFQAGLGIARNILSDRLAKLVAGGILERTPDPADKRKVIYALTDKGEALLPVVLALRQWGEDWGQARRRSSSPTAQPAARSAGSASRPTTAASFKLSELTWCRAGEPQPEPPLQGRRPIAASSLAAYS